MAPVVLEGAETTNGAATLIDTNNFFMAQENSDMGIVKSDIKDMAAGNGKAAETKGTDADKKGRKTKKENDESDLLAALSDRRSYFVKQEKRTEQEKSMATDESDTKDAHSNGKLAEDTEAANKKKRKTKKEAENRDDFMAALSDRRTYFAAQVKRTEQKKAMGIVDPDIQQVEGAGSGKKQSKSKKETQNVCIII